MGTLTIQTILGIYFCIIKVLAFSDTLYFEVKENSLPQTYVGRIQTKSGFTYRFNEDPLEFYLDPESGVIVTSHVPIDRETKSLYNFVILSSSPTYPIQVKIRVLDINDNMPFWPNYINTNLSFSESAPIGTRVILDNAIDLDEGDLQYMIDYVSDTTSNNNLDSTLYDLPFKLNYNATTQFLYLEVCSKLDREIKSNYLLNITAYDEDFQSSSTIFNVKILDSNDNPPIFDHSDYVVSLNESIGKDVSILQVQATDADEENSDNSRISYYLNSDDFKIDAKTGVISTAHDGPFMCGINSGKSSDNECWRICVFTVFAHDFGIPRQDGRTYVTAKIHDTNNHVPIIKFRYFSKSDVAHVDENASNGSVVAAVSVIDFDQGSNGQTWLEIINGNNLNHFRLESIGNSHIIKVNSILDRERIALYNLTMMAHDRGSPSKNSTDNLIIIVQDHNDHGPKFDKEVYETSIVESQYQTGIFVYALHATDQDEGINSQIFYSISGPDSHYFKIDSATGLITTEKLIDREVTSAFELRVAARDGGSNPKWAHALLKIKVLDINDQVPSVELSPTYYFNDEASQYEVYIHEGHFLDLNLIIKDNDLGANGTIDVEILYDFNNLFKIDPESMKLVTTQKLDFETCNFYKIVLLAKDRAPVPHQLYSFTTIIINVKNTNDELPMLYPSKYYSFIPINAVGSFNYSVVINKLQIKNNDFFIPVHFVLHSRDDVVKQLFYINSNGEMRFKNNVNVRLLKNVPKNFNFDIECLGCNSNHSISHMNVFLLDTDVTHHDFSRRVHNFTIEENLPIGTLVGELDVDINQYDLYIIQGDPDEQFNLIKNTLKTNKVLDRESKSNYKLQVIAIKENNFFYIDINIELLDRNDCDPYFTSPFSVITINEDVPVMYTINRLKAFDPDLNSDQNSNEYEFIENPFDMFIIEENELKLAKPISEIMNHFKRSQFYPMIKVTIKAIDKNVKINEFEVANKQKQVNTSELKCHFSNIFALFVEVKPVFRRKPRFVKNFYEIFLSESTPVNEKFFKIDVHNLYNDSFAFLLKNENSNSFDILPSGHLYVKKQLDREKIDIYLFDIILQNVQFISKNVTSLPLDICQMLIHIKDVNDNEPVFDYTSYRFAVPENVSSSFFIGQIRATDQDLGPNSQIIYSIVNSYYSSYLDIDHINGYLWTNINYDREVLPYFEIVVQANDQPIDEEKFTSQALIRIDILDINDNKPIFEIPSNVTVIQRNDDDSMFGEMTVSELIRVNSTLVRFKAIDLDSDSQITYVLHDQAGIASINSSSGVFTLVKELDRETRDNYDLVIEASDGKYRSFFNLRIIVEDVNDCKPIWTNFTENELFIPENISIGTEIYSFTAIDYDLGTNALFHFSIENYSGNQKYFDILNQKLVVINRLDYEKTKTHHLNISLIETTSNYITSTRSIKINLLDINDCQPTFIRRTETEVIRILENTDIGTKLLSLQAYDCDVNDVLIYEIVSCNTHYHTHRNIYQKDHELQHKHDSNNCPLKINTKTGEIININNLDREVIESINLKLSVKDSIGHMDKMKVIFIIDDINDESPMFISPNKIIIPNELNKSNIVIGAIKAVDLDLGVNSVITYKLEHSHYSHLFELDRFSGIFRTKTSLDVSELKEAIYMNVSAADGAGLKTYDLIELIVEPNKPYLGTVNLVMDINENLPLGTEISKLECHDRIELTTTGCRFHLVNATDRNFEVDSFTGTITVVDLIDREMLDKRLLKVLIISQHNLQIMQVHINIIDQNDNPPYLKNTSIVVHLQETLSVGSQVFDISQLIADEDTNNKFDFQIINCSSCNGVFSLNRKTGVFTLQSQLDCEKMDKYKILFGVSDGIYLLTSLMDIIIVDENDNKPYFNQSNYVFWIEENIERGTIIAQVQAFDADISNKNLVYSIIHDDEQDHLQAVFSLDSRSGQFTLSKKLDYEIDPNEYNLFVEASDGKFNSSPIKVTFKLINLPDNPPVFENTVYKLEIIENKIFNDILCLKAFDADLKNFHLDAQMHDNEQKILNLTYHLDSNNFISDEMNGNNIQINSNNGCISIVKPLDREKTPTINLTVLARDGYFNAVAIIYIKILDENDNHPVFDKKTAKYLKIVENIPIDTIVYTFSASDYDEPPNSYIKYELININIDGDNITTKLPFVIGPIDGQLKVTSLIDREQTDHYDVIVRATDYGLKYTDFLCRIDIEDVIDNSPVFRKDLYEIKVFENVTVGKIIFKLDAYDADPTDEINYKIISGDTYGNFYIEDDNIAIAVNLNYEEIDVYNLKINAIDKAGNIDTTNLQINVINVLDEKPIFPESSYYLNWFENRLGIIGQFEAFPENKLTSNKKRTHLRSTSHNHINYLLLNNFEDCFQLNSSNALLTIVKSVDRETLIQLNIDAIIELKVMAIDSLSRLSNVMNIFIKIIDLNDNVPVFLNTDYEFHLKENQLYDCNTTIGIIETFDPDEDDVITYVLDSNYEDKFLINSKGEMSLPSSLIFDREQQSIYQMEVTITDSKHSARTKINVIIDDLNDCAPKITKINNIFMSNTNMNSNTFKLKIPIQKLDSILEKNFPLIGLQINDCDDGLNGRVQVRIDDSNLYNVFDIDDQTGVIKLDSRNTNLQKEMLLQIPNIDLIIADLSESNQLTSEYSINLDFTDMELYKEQNLVHKNFVELFVSESIPINETLFKFEMASSISDINIYAGDLYNYFTVVDNCLINSRLLDYEYVKSYDLYLQAVNHQKDLEEFQYIFVRVNIVNENDNPPSFLYPVYNVSILEEEENIFVTQVWANDIDSANTKIKYKLLNSNNIPFKIDSTTGHIFTTTKIDRESISLFRLIVSAEDEDGLFSTSTVIVNIEDKNDNPPRFTHLLRTNISESTPIGSFIIQVKSSDKDLVNNSQVTYNLLTETKTFRIDSSNGNIYLIDELDREDKEEYFLTVSANDGSWKSQTIVTLYVLDENDCKPQFEKNKYEFNIRSSEMMVNHSFGRVKALDQDKALNGLVSYGLKNPSKYFGVHAKTGNLFIKQVPKLFSSELKFLNQHILTVVAFDNGLISRSSEVTVLIRCHSDENFDLSNKIYVVIPEDLENDTLLYTSNAIIHLIDETNLVKTFYNQLLFNGQSIAEKGKNYSLLIDNNYETLVFNLSVISKNKFPPVFANTINNSTIVSEKIHGNHLINEFFATDNDESDLNKRILYSFNVTKLHWNKNIDEYLYLNYKDSHPNLFKKNLSSFEIIYQIDELSHIKNPFVINETNGKFYLSHHLDFEIITGYSLIISAKDCAWYSLESVFPFDVWVEDVEDFIGYNLIDSDKLYHLSPKPDPMSIGVMVVIFFFVILILVISTSFFVYHNQKKRLSPERKINVHSLRSYDCQFSTEIVSRIQQAQEQEMMNNINNVNHRTQAQIRLNSNLPQQTHQHSQPLPSVPTSCHLSQPVIASIHSQSIEASSSNSMKIQTNSIQKGHLPAPPQHSVSSTRMIIKPDIVSPSTNPTAVSNTIMDSRIPVPPTVASSIYTHSNSENYTDNYSNILASAEHYDLENASSIAPSDIDIVYHYKGFRNRESLHQIHNNQKHAPLSRLSPSVSELSSAPHILTLQDLSPQSVPPPQPPILNRIHKPLGNRLEINNHPHEDDMAGTENSYAYSGFDDNFEKDMFGRSDW